MKTQLFIILLLMLTFTCLSCGETKKKKKPVYVDVSRPSEETSYAEIDFNQNDISSSSSFNEIIKIPYRNQDGVKYVQVRVNGVAFEMIFDTGCSIALISVAEANYLYQKGKLSPNDVLGYSKAEIADGSIVENMVVNLSEVVIGDKIVCYDVTATVSKNVNAPLLLGNEVLDRVASITIDNEHSTIDFKLK